jgi:hypothetical protein
MLMESAGVTLQDLSAAVVRLNPRYCVASIESLSGEQLSCLGANADATVFSAVLIDLESGRLSIKAISAKIEALLEQCRTAVRIDALLAHLSSRERDRILSGLILEGILEVAVENGFVSQCAAYHLIVRSDEGLVGTSKLATLSLKAIKHGQRLCMERADLLAARLYFYNRIPATAAWRDLWPDAGAVLRYLGAVPGSALRQDLASWAEFSSLPANTPWLSWCLRLSDPHGVATCKLYISPEPQYTRVAFAEVVSLLSMSNALALKIGSNAHGLLRADKLVMYFERRDDLFNFCERLLRRISGLIAQGVPFSATVDEGGLLSWGTDPPRSERGLGWYADDSWRIWICNRLALALVAATESPQTGLSPWRYALVKLWLSGVDTRKWIFRDHGWR